MNVFLIAGVAFLLGFIVAALLSVDNYHKGFHDGVLVRSLERGDTE